MNCRSRVCLSTPIYTNQRYNYKTPDLFSLSRIFTDLIMHNYRLNQSALMTRCGTDFRHQYGIFGGESQTSVSRNATRPGAKKDGCFRRLELGRLVCFKCLFFRFKQDHFKIDVKAFTLMRGNLKSDTESLKRFRIALKRKMTIENTRQQGIEVSYFYYKIY